MVLWLCPHWQRRNSAIASQWSWRKCHVCFGCQNVSCQRKWFYVWQKLGGLVEDCEQTTPFNKLAPPFSSLRLLLSLSLSLAFCSWPGGSLQHLKGMGSLTAWLVALSLGAWEVQGTAKWELGRGWEYSSIPSSKQKWSLSLRKESKTVSLCRNRAISPCQNRSHLTC